MARARFPAVVLLHGCNGNWGRLDERWGVTIASWGYVTLTIDSFGPRGIKNSCGSDPPADLLFDAYRGLDFLVQRTIRRSEASCHRWFFSGRLAHPLVGRTRRH